MTVVDDIKATVRISDLAANYGDVKRRGRLHVCRCLCGQNSDRNPSFTLYGEDNHFHCFACGRHGSVIDLVMLTENLDFKAAVGHLRNRYLLGRDDDRPHRVTRPEPTPLSRVIGEDVFAMMEVATAHYQTALQHSPRALSYMRKRGLNDDTIAKMRIGYADGSLGRALFAQDFDLALAAQIGLLTPKGEMLRGRVMFPVLDAHGRPVWMIARALDDATQPKYLGLPDGLVHKQPMVLGTPKRGSIWVEGAFDVAALVQWGLDAEYLLVGLLGTAHTQAVALVSPLQDFRESTHYIALDQDDAGNQSAEHLLSTLRTTNTSSQTTRVQCRGAKDCGELLASPRDLQAHFIKSLHPP